MAERPTRLKRPWPDPKDSISPFIGRLPQVAADWDTPTRQASTGLNVNPNALNGETFTYDDGGPNEKTWTFQTVLTDVDGNILIAATRELTHDNMIAAINLDPAGAGSQYAASMTAPVGIFAQSQGGFTALVTFIERGIVGNSIVLSALNAMPSNPPLRGRLGSSSPNAGCCGDHTPGNEIGGCSNRPVESVCSRNGPNSSPK